ncbi:MAG: hypothetical protein KGZ68_14965, partial [Dechloromonas sp.]|nr:hypothetical protein [Dechloromonas sp.]
MTTDLKALTADTSIPDTALIFGADDPTSAQPSVYPIDDVKAKVLEAPAELEASTTAAASLNVPHGVAPTSPVDGDIWTTTAGIYAQLNGTTSQIAIAASMASTYAKQIVIQVFTSNGTYAPTAGMKLAEAFAFAGGGGGG